MSTALKVVDLCKSFGGVNANDSITMEVQKGSITGLIGPNGSGKTTLFNSIVGHHPIDAGTIYFDGEDVSHFSVGRIARRGLLRTFQQTRIYKEMNCVQNMLISLPPDWRVKHLFGGFDKATLEQAEGLLDYVGLYQKRKLMAGDLSFGQQKLLEFAMALMNKPRMLLLDEPTGGINPTLINEIIAKLKQVNKDFNLTFLIIEHNMRVMMNLTETIYCLANGRILAHGSPKEIRNNPRVVDAYLGG